MPRRFGHGATGFFRTPGNEVRAQGALKRVGRKYVRSDRKPQWKAFLEGGNPVESPSADQAISSSVQIREIHLPLSERKILEKADNQPLARIKAGKRVVTQWDVVVLIARRACGIEPGVRYSESVSSFEKVYDPSSMPPLGRSLLQFHFQRIVVAFADIVAAVADAAVLRERPQQLVLGDRGLAKYSLRNERVERIGHLFIQEAASPSCR